MRESATRSRMRKIERILWAGFDFFLPPYCVGCGRFGDTWCESCQGALAVASGPSCTSCGLPRLQRICPACDSGIESLQVDAVAAYRPPLSKALITFKYRPNRAFAEILATWLHHKLNRLNWEPDVVVPVPISKLRLRQRGYNQVELITSALARSTRIPQDHSILIRVRETRSQVGLDPTARFLNLEQAFGVEPGIIQKRSVLIVDDLLTSGATFFSCAQTLFDAGASKVFALAIARA